MRSCKWMLLLSCLLAGAFAPLPIEAASGDVEGSSDYPGWPRMPGYEITDYDEDNPAVFTFSVSRPLAIDANHLEGIPVEGHRYVIRYEWASAHFAPSLLATQRHYEKLASDQGYALEKTGAVGDVTETFHLSKAGREVWVYLDPSIRVNVVTIVESRGALSIPTIAAATSPSTPVPAPAPTPAEPPPAPTPEATAPPKPEPSPTSAADDPLNTALMNDGRAVLPVTFLPGKPDLDTDSQPVIDRVVAILKLHPDLLLSIEGHTDLTGDAEFNQELSLQRARAVRALLIAGHIGHRRLVAVGLGGTQPLADESTAEGREKDRRIELVVRKATAQTESPQTNSPENAPKQLAFPQVDAPLTESTGTDSYSFHPAAPDGVNYYPSANTGTSSTSPSSGTHSSK